VARTQHPERFGVAPARALGFAAMNEQRWRFWVDRGGTFTDVVARSPDGALRWIKLLSEDPGRYGDAAEEAMRRLTGTPHGPLPPAELRLGTTVATNALLERKGEPVLLAITRGFGDALRIGTQERPDIFARRIILPEPLYADVVEIEERVSASGDVLIPLERRAARAALQAAHDRGLRAVAIVLMHGYRFTAHEQALAEIAAEIGFTQISASHRTAPLIRLVARGDTSVADAYLSPVLRRYVAGLEAGLGEAVTALYMQSNGGLASAAAFHGKDAILSGPAGGVVGMAAVGQEAGFDHLVGFDMGGTSTDVSHWAGHYERDSDARLAGVRLRTPMMRVTTIAAGGGSICHFDGARFLVGPDSAGAVPGPACYRRGGPLTITDCNLLLGKLHADHFPKIFGESGTESIDVDAARSRIDDLIAEVEAATGRLLGRGEAVEGFLRVAVANMANAIKTVSLRRGHDVTRATLVCFGGAGGQHACEVADTLGITRVLVHPLASVLSAYGIGLAKRTVLREATLALSLDDVGMAAIEAAVARLRGEAEQGLLDEGIGEAQLRCAAIVSIRPTGNENSIEVPFGSLAAMRHGFAAGWRTRFGFDAEGALIAETARVEASSLGEADDIRVELLPRSAGPREVALFFQNGSFHPAPLFLREELAAGFTIDGAALVVDAVSTIVVEPGWRLTVDGKGNLILSRIAPAIAAAGGAGLDPVRLEIMGSLFMAIAEEMGAALQHSARSVNIRERLDFSCALFDRDGRLVANAPHMPVHLGSMGESVRAVLARRGSGADGRGMRPGDAYALNAPYDGGTHLPDITVVMPVFAADDASAPAWFTAARGHHADVGGISPGSMPPFSRNIDEEGIILADMLLVDQGRFLEDDLRALLGSGRWPARNPDQNIADLKAQIAAGARGAADLRRLAVEQGRVVVDAYMGHVQAHAEEAVRGLIRGLSNGAFRLAMDNGGEIAVAIAIDRSAGAATIDFTGSSAQRGDNFNAPLPVVRAAVLYVVRCLVGGEIPMNEGCLRPLTIIVPEGSMLNPKPPAAVVAGNVETSQAITDALFGALGAMAAAQGTMNNFSFGSARYQYYETIAGGSGAGPGFDGADVVQTHMTNSRLTDPEVLEANYPVLLEAFAIRRGSGGAGAYHGGDGAMRRIRFLEAMEAGILSNRRSSAPFGLAGGSDGARGANRIERADGTQEELGAVAAAAVGPGDVFVIVSPGGGGFG
jgi:5-oxoprolinase (ATP-hydrolysing)